MRTTIDWLMPIDWERPWLASVRDAAATLDLCQHSIIGPLNGQAAALGLRNQSGLPLSFVRKKIGKGNSQKKTDI
jgi:hypothetical protein